MNDYIVSARKYRPSTFDTVVGQQSLTHTLKNAIATNKLAHAYLFCGPRGVGKTTCARIFAKTINCLTPTADGESCNQCESCVAFNEQRSYNIHELDAASNNSVDGIRELCAQVMIPPQIGNYKVYIVDEVHMLSTQAFNAFLKTLEEPPRHAVFILATTEKHKILPTILSRCQTYDFNRITQKDTIDHLAYVAQKEGVSFENRALSIIAQKADGGMRDALSIFDQLVSSTNGNLTYQEVIDNLNVLDYDYFFRMTDACMATDVTQALLILDETIRKGFDPHLFITGFASHLRDLLVSKEPSTIHLLEVGEEVAQRYYQQSQACQLGFIYKALEESNACDLNYKLSKNKRLLVELSCIRMAQILQPEVQVQPRQPQPIKPIQSNNVAQAQPVQQPQAAAQSVASVVQAPQAARPASEQATYAQTPVAQATVSHSAPAAETSKPKESSLGKPKLKSISLKRGVQKAEEQASTYAPLQQMNQPVEEDGLKAAWKEYTQGREIDPILYNTIISTKPNMLNATEFEVVVDNPDQVARMHERGTDILHFLRNKLQNSSITMHIRESEKNEKVRNYSDREKYNYFAQINPDLTMLKDRFGLDLA